MFRLSCVGLIPHLAVCRFLAGYVHNFTYIEISVGTRSAAKEVTKVCHGTLKQEGKTWFHQLSDKSMFKFVMHVVDNQLMGDIYH